MKPTMTELDRLVSNVLNDQLDDEVVNSLSVVAESIGRSQRFVENLLTSQSASGKAITEAINSIMRIFEGIAEISEPMACKLMAHLWPISAALQMHDVCDAIDIWLFNNKSPELSRYLLMLASSQSDDSVRRHYEKLVA